MTAGGVKLDDLDDDNVVLLFGRVMLELRQRGIVRSGNSPIADIAERLVADFYDGHVAPPNERSYDVLARDGRKLQVKALRRTQPSSSSLSPLRTHDFDAVVVVVFDINYIVQEAFVIPLLAVKDHQGWSKTWGSHRLSLTKRLCADPRVTR